MALNLKSRLNKVTRSRHLFSHVLQSSFEVCQRCSSAQSNNAPVERIRNLGILAHIDAGKTTTTERMLFFSGKISSMGEVHHGNTVTDYMEQERNRGITITSASASFMWKEYQFNLVDTPGHIDFTMEVENALSVIDGCIVILDSSAGVEAQTQTVWRQADHKKIPRIVYANKMDRQDASLDLCENSLHQKLGVEVFVTQLPIIDKGFAGVVDLLHLKKNLWLKNLNGNDTLQSLPLDEISDGILWEEATKAREMLVDKVSGCDDKLADDIISSDSIEKISASALSAAIRRATISCKGVPLLCGSSYKNKGVQPLMDAVIRFLPSPLECSNQLYVHGFKNNLCAHAFKVVHHKHHGPLVFLRLYSGELVKNERIFNLRLNIAEKCANVMIATADEFEEVPLVTSGNIAVVSGLNETRAGDLVTNTAAAAKKAFEYIAEIKGVTENDAKDLLSVGASAPESVFFCSIEAPSQSQQVALDKALVRLQREDPSLTVSFNEETSQVILGGMGELHLNIIKERLKTEYKLDILLGPIQIAYREALNSPIEDKIRIEENIGSARQLVELDVLIGPLEKGSNKEFLRMSSPEKETQEKLNKFMNNTKIMQAIRHGVKEGLKYGPKLHCPLMSAYVHIRDMHLGKGTSPTMIGSAVTQCVRKAIASAHTLLMEPIMYVEVALEEHHQSVVSADLSRRRAEILNIDNRLNYRVIQARVPLSEMLGYANNLRYLTSGTGTFSMEFQEYQALTQEQEVIVIQKETGYNPL